MLSKKDKLTAVHSFTVFPQDMNYGDSLFGGKVLAEMDIAGVKVVRRALYGTECDSCVTASFERVDFKRPGKLGDLITMTAEIKSLGKSSIQVRVTVIGESLKGELEEICAGNITFVALQHGKPHAHGLNFEKLSINKSE